MSSDCYSCYATQLSQLPCNSTHHVQLALAFKDVYVMLCIIWRVCQLRHAHGPAINCYCINQQPVLQTHQMASTLIPGVPTCMLVYPTHQWKHQSTAPCNLLALCPTQNPATCTTNCYCDNHKPVLPYPTVKPNGQHKTQYIHAENPVYASNKSSQLAPPLQSQHRWCQR